jgi:hypothetical protein
MEEYRKQFEEETGTSFKDCEDKGVYWFAYSIWLESKLKKVEELDCSGNIEVAYRKGMEHITKKVKDSLTYNDDWKKLTTDELRGAVYVTDKARKILEDVK